MASIRRPPGGSEGRGVDCAHEFSDRNDARRRAHLEAETTFKDFFASAKLNDNAHLSTGAICGVLVEEIEDPFMQQVRYLDKIVDELARGKKMSSIKRGDS